MIIHQIRFLKASWISIMHLIYCRLMIEVNNRFQLSRWESRKLYAAANRMGEYRGRRRDPLCPMRIGRTRAQKVSFFFMLLCPTLISANRSSLLSLRPSSRWLCCSARQSAASDGRPTTAGGAFVDRFLLHRPIVVFNMVFSQIMRLKTLTISPILGCINSYF